MCRLDLLRRRRPARTTFVGCLLSMRVRSSHVAVLQILSRDDALSSHLQSPSDTTSVCFCPFSGDVDLFLVNPPAGQELVILGKIYDVVMKEFFVFDIECPRAGD